MARVLLQKRRQFADMMVHEFRRRVAVVRSTFTPRTFIGQLLLTGLLLAALPLHAAATDVVPAVQTIVVFGDSQAQGLAAGLQRASRHGGNVKIQNRTKPGTAISQANNYDWPAAIAAYTPDDNVKTAVLMFGGNDRLPIRQAAGAGIPFRTPVWHDEYRRRVTAILNSLTSHGMHIIWVADPVCRDPRYSDDMAYLNGIFQDVIAHTGAVVLNSTVFLNIGNAVPGSDGKFAAYGPGPDGSTQRLRLDDGIHFTPDGYDLLAARVIAAVNTPATPPPAAAPAAKVP